MPPPDPIHMPRKAEYNPVWETMTRFKRREGGTVRVWRDRGQQSTGPDPEVVSCWFEKELKDKNYKKIIEAFCELRGIAAIEVLDYDGNGLVFYPNWDSFT